MVVIFERSPFREIKVAASIGPAQPLSLGNSLISLSIPFSDYHETSRAAGVSPDLGVLATSSPFPGRVLCPSRGRLRRPSSASLAVLAYLDEDGVRATELARLSGRHKQIVGAVDELEGSAMSAPPTRRTVAPAIVPQRGSAAAAGGRDRRRDRGRHAAAIGGETTRRSATSSEGGSSLEERSPAEQAVQVTGIR